MSDDINWSQAWAQTLDADAAAPPSGLRVSTAGKCIRRLTYAAAGQPVTNPPDQQGQHRMALGHAAEALIIRALNANGWETKHTCLDEGQLTLTLSRPDITPPVTGHPDGIARHPKLTNGHWVTLECKSMGEAAADRVEADGIFAHYPEYKAQIALYTEELHRRGLVSHRSKGVFAMMSREGRMLPVQRLTWEPSYAFEMESRLGQAHQYAQDGELPERPYPVDSKECGYCPYFNLCWGSEAKAGKRGRPVELDDPELAASAQRWLEGRRLTDAEKPALEDALRRSGGRPIKVGGVTVSYFVPRDTVRYDHDLLGRWLAADQLDACRTEGPQPRIWLRPSGR